MKVALLGSGVLANEVREALVGLGAEVVSFCPEQAPFHVQKSSLALHEEIPGAQRFYDLFRVVHQQRYSPLLQEQLRDGVPGFTAADNQHLLQPGESFVDVDVVVDTLGLQRSSRRAPLLNEYFAPVQDRLWAGECPTGIGQGLQGGGVLALVVQSPACAPLVAELVSWIQARREQTEGGGRELVVVGRSFETLEGCPQWEQLLALGREISESARQCFEQQLARWQRLEDFEQAKWPRPVEGQGCLQFFEGFWPLGVDYLSDRQQVFLTLERPGFRGAEDLRTLAIDHILFEPGLMSEQGPDFFCFGIRPREVGYFNLSSEQASALQVAGLIQALGRLFSKREGQEEGGE